MKKIIAIIAGALLATTLAGCGGSINASGIGDAISKADAYDDKIAVEVSGYYDGKHKERDNGDISFTIYEYGKDDGVDSLSDNATVTLKQGSSVEELADLKEGDFIKVKGTIPARQYRSDLYLSIQNAEIVK